MPNRRESEIPEDIASSVVKQAINEFTPDIEGFGPSSTYDLLYEGKRYPPKAILGLVLRISSGDPSWNHNDFSAGEKSKCFRVLQKAGFEIVRKPQANQIQSPTYWWVNQRTYKEERSLSLIWAPQRTAQGTTPFHWENLSKVKTGDIVLHYNSNTNSQSIVSVSVALGDGNEASKPEELKGPWESSGWKVDLSYHDLSHPISKSKIQQSFRTSDSKKYQPLNSTGSVNQGYLFKIEPRIVKALISDLDLNALPDELREKLNMDDIANRAWTFQFSQDHFRREAFSKLPYISWTVKTHKKDITDGDRVYIWETKGVGVIAVGTIQGGIENRVDEPEQTAFWVDKSRGSGMADRVRIKIERTLEHSLSKKECLENDVLKTLKCITAVQATIHDLTPEQDQEFRYLLDSKMPSIESPYTIDDALKDLFLSRGQLERVLDALNIGKNIILQGAPGVGKTYVAKRIAYAAIGAKSNVRVQMVQFHQSYSYEDFIQGYRPSEDNQFILKKGLFYNFCETAQSDPDRQYVFIIDEINRGNLSKIFGELMMLIERDKRDSEYAIPLTYSDTPFYVPPNVHLLGLMNTADRSLALVDYALRRRFKFFSLQPEFGESFRNHLDAQGVDTAIIDKLVKKIHDLNQAIEESRDLGRGFKIGHSYFCSTSGYSVGEWGQWLEEIIETEIIPLIEEYWVDDPGELKKHIDNLRA